MAIVLPEPLRPGDRIGVTSPSSGVPAPLVPRFDVAVRALRDRGFEVVVGDCMDGEDVMSAPKAERAAELTAMLTDPTIRAVIPPWGGAGTGLDILDQLDWDAIAAAEPTWAIGYSDTTAWLLPLTLRTGWASLHGSNLMDTAFAAPEGLLHWTDVAAATGPVTQRGVGRFRDRVFDDYAVNPTIDTFDLVGTGDWSLLDPTAGSVDVTGRLAGGCIEVLGAICATYADVAGFGREHAADGLVVYVEASDEEAYSICRNLHAMRYAGWFDNASAVLVARTLAPGSEGMSQHDAVRDALGELDVPVILDVECGHVAPYLPLVNGALARVVMDGQRREITQDLSR